jgi:methyl-accepting chemotaxis protein
MNLRQLGAPAALILLMAAAFGFLTKAIPAEYVSNLFWVLGIVSIVSLVYVASQMPQKGPAISLGPLVDALKAAGRGKKPRVPDDAAGELAEAYDEIGRVAKRSAELTEEVERLEQLGPGTPSIDVSAIVEAAGRAAQGERVRPPSGASSEVAQLYGELAQLGERVSEAERREKTGKIDLPAIIDAATRAAQGERVRPPSGASSDVAELYGELAQLGERITEAERREKTSRIDLPSIIDAAGRAAKGERIRVPAGVTADVAELYGEITALAERVVDAEQREKARRSELAAAAQVIEDSFPRLNEAVTNVLSSSEQATGHIREMTTSLANISQSIETLASSAEESSSSILEMTATNDETAEQVGELGSSVRETVSSIEEMAYSIREVAKNVDALSLTAEETSSSMNEMDVSIDQVQSNANETARLSEEVATDAEKGAEAILKTIGEIYRIKESSQEAVAVISNLGFRIEAIGQILQVIDDVAEQTNLLALNAAIIAAQAGEHGKGFAVVADEIKDLAERAGGSTKEIAELIKTIQSESKNAIAAVERGAHNVDRGVEVSNEAERALKKILESSQKSTNMVRAIARATVEQAKGSKQVTDAIGRIAETVQQIAAATAEQARGSELIMKSAEKMRTITQHVERSSQEQARGGRQITGAIEQISNMVNSLNGAQRTQMRGGEQLIDTARRIEESGRNQEQAVRQLMTASERLRRAVA